MKTERSFFRIWTGWWEDKAPFHPGTPARQQLRSLEISSLSSAARGEGSFISCEVRQEPSAPHAVTDRVQFQGWS